MNWAEIAIYAPITPHGLIGRYAPSELKFWLLLINFLDKQEI